MPNCQKLQIAGASVDLDKVDQNLGFFAKEIRTLDCFFRFKSGSVEHCAVVLSCPSISSQLRRRYHDINPNASGRFESDLRPWRELASTKSAYKQCKAFISHVVKRKIAYQRGLTRRKWQRAVDIGAVLALERGHVRTELSRLSRWHSFPARKLI